jgi:hypothetical protein
MTTIGDTYLLEMLLPDTENWRDVGMKSRFKTLEEAQLELENTLLYYNHSYKFRINHIVCNESVVFETQGLKDTLAFNE